MPLRIALFGQAAFGRDVLVRLLEQGYEIAAVYAAIESESADPVPAEIAIYQGAIPGMLPPVSESTRGCV